MNTAFRCIILLACITICTSKSFLSCRCINTINAVLPSRIADVKVFEPRPYCSKKEVIVLLKEGGSRCLDPKGEFAQLLLQQKQKRALHADKMRASSLKTTTTSAPVSANVAPTSS